MRHVTPFSLSWNADLTSIPLSVCKVWCCKERQVSLQGARPPASWKHACWEETVSPAGIPGSFQTWMALSSIVKPQSPRGASPSGSGSSQSAAFESFRCQVRECWCSFSVHVRSLRLAADGWKTLRCARERVIVVFVFILSAFFFVLFCFCWRAVSQSVDSRWHLLRHLEPASGRSVIQLVPLSSRVMPPRWEWHTLPEHMLPGGSHKARNTEPDRADYSVGHNVCWS